MPGARGSTTGAVQRAVLEQHNLIVSQLKRSVAVVRHEREPILLLLLQFRGALKGSGPSQRRQNRQDQHRCGCHPRRDAAQS